MCYFVIWYTLTFGHDLNIRNEASNYRKHSVVGTGVTLRKRHEHISEILYEEEIVSRQGERVWRSVLFFRCP